MWIPFYTKKQQGLAAKRERQQPPRKRARHAKDSATAEQKNSPADDVAPRVTINSLPLEILMEILDLTVPAGRFLRPRGFFPDSEDPQAQRPDIHSAWRQSMANKRAISSVCKAWCMMGRRFLYHDVTIIDSHGVDALLWTVRSNPDICRLVASLNFIYYPDLECSYGAVKEIITRCSSVRRVNLHPCDGHYPRYGSPYAFPASVTSLAIGPYVGDRYFGFKIVPPSSNHLQELDLPLAPRPLLPRGYFGIEMSLPELHTLHITCIPHTPGLMDIHRPWFPPPEHIPYWNTPKLRRITFRTLDSGPIRYTKNLYAQYKYVLSLHGKDLEYVQFPDSGDPRDEEDPDHDPEERNYGPLLALCPAVQHVILPSWARFNPGQVFPSVKWLDVWCESAAEEFDRTYWPNVEGIRRFDVYLRDFVVDAPVAIDRCVLDWKRMDLPGLSLVNLTRNGMTDIIPVMRLNEFEDIDTEGDDEEQVLQDLTPNGQPSDQEGSSSSDESSLESGSEPDLDAAANDAELEAATPRPKLRPRLRRFLRATMPKRVFARFERAVLDLVIQPS
ncbi:hypothetical protein C8R45DRAFT_119167 [Mycena sanguinolenta]|nr:hypothetical protein C8R45DRAFT_119167 [Mycena sanguinolenta]